MIGKKWLAIIVSMATVLSVVVIVVPLLLKTPQTVTAGVEIHNMGLIPLPLQTPIPVFLDTYHGRVFVYHNGKVHDTGLEGLVTYYKGHYFLWNGDLYEVEFSFENDTVYTRLTNTSIHGFIPQFQGNYIYCQGTYYQDFESGLEPYVYVYSLDDFSLVAKKYVGHFIMLHMYDNTMYGFSLDERWDDVTGIMAISSQSYIHYTPYIMFPPFYVDREYIIVPLTNGQVLLLNEKLEIVSSFHVSSHIEGYPDIGTVIRAGDIDGDGVNEYLFNYENQIYLLDPSAMSVELFYTLDNVPDDYEVAQVSIADLNGDGKLDVVIGNGHEVEAFSVDENGKKTRIFYYTPFAYSLEFEYMCVLDLNEDGHLDIYLATTDRKLIFIFLQNSGKRFMQVTSGKDIFPLINIGTTDYDHDGLEYLEELSVGTDPFNPDSDGDGIGDGDELLNGSNPLLFDNWVVIGGISLVVCLAVATAFIIKYYVLKNR